MLVHEFTPWSEQDEYEHRVVFGRCNRLLCSERLFVHWKSVCVKWTLFLELSLDMCYLVDGVEVARVPHTVFIICCFLFLEV